MRSLLVLLIAGCGQSAAGGIPDDLSMPVLPDLAMNVDLTPPSACDPVDPMTDGQPCGTAACPAGTARVGTGADCRCWLKCDPNLSPTTCACDRRCAPLTSGDAGVVGGACLLANGPGERCGQAGGAGLNAQGCAQTMLCVNADDAGLFRDCAGDCTAGQSCPLQSSCVQLNGVAQKACIIVSVMGGLPAGAACTAADACVTGYLCDVTGGATCKPQCDRAGAACASGACSALGDANGTVGFVCR